MEHWTKEQQRLAIEALQSIIRKSEKALAHMPANAPQTRQVATQLRTAQIGVDSLVAWQEGMDADRRRFAGCLAGRHG